MPAKAGIQGPQAPASRSWLLDTRFRGCDEVGKRWDAVISQRAPGGAMIQQSVREGFAGAPRVTDLQVIPVAGRDSMLLNLSGAHAPFFTRNIVILTDNSGHVGVGEVPGGETIRRTLEDAHDLVVGQTIGACNNILAA